MANNTFIHLSRSISVNNYCCGAATDSRISFDKIENLKDKYPLMMRNLVRNLEVSLFELMDVCLNSNIDSAVSGIESAIDPKFLQSVAGNWNTHYTTSNPTKKKGEIRFLRSELLRIFVFNK